MLRVAIATKRDPRVVARQPFAWTAATLCVLLGFERSASLVREGERLHMARLANLAMLAPEGLAAEQRSLAGRAGMLEDPEEALAAGLGVLAQAMAAGWIPMDHGAAPAVVEPSA